MDEKRVLLEAQVAHHAKIIVDLKIHINALLPIVRLPPEILGRIFLFCLGPDDYLCRTISHPRARTQVTGTEWRRFTHVCHHWREVALADPRLWIDIRLGSRSILKTLEFVKRSKRVPLRISGTSTETRMEALDILTSEIARTQSLVLETPLETLRAIADGFPSSAPSLQYLCLSRPYISNHSNSQFSPHPVFFSRCATPSLVELSISMYRFEWTKGILPKTLTKFSLCCPIRLSEAETKAMFPVMEVIGELPALEHLDLSGVLCPPPSSPHHAQATQISLPRLQTLKLDASPLACSQFMELSSFPGFVQISLLLSSVCTGDEVESLASALAPKVQALGPVLLSIRAFKYIGLYKAHLNLNPTLDATPDNPKPADVSQPFIAISFNHYVYHSRCSPIASICTHLPLDSVSIFTAMEGPMDSVPMLCSGWLKLLEALHSVEYFAFDETCVTTDNSLMTATHILMLLGTMSRFTSSGAEGQGSCLMPNLKHLYLKSLLFRRTQFEPDSEPDNLLVEILCDSLVAHAAQDGDTTEGGLEEVIFRRCYNIFEKDIETVEEYVAVDWDGESMEKVFSDEDSEEN